VEAAGANEGAKAGAEVGAEAAAAEAGAEVELVGADAEVEALLFRARLREPSLALAPSSVRLLPSAATAPPPLSAPLRLPLRPLPPAISELEAAEGREEGREEGGGLRALRSRLDVTEAEAEVEEEEEGSGLVSDAGDGRESLGGGGGCVIEREEAAEGVRLLCWDQTAADCEAEGWERGGRERVSL
jgi:hypothetical protein